MVIITNVRILFISCLHYRLLVFFILCSILLWFATFAVIAGFVSFPAENPDLYGTFFGLFANFVAMGCRESCVEQSPRDSLLCCGVRSPSLCVGGGAMCILSLSFPDRERSAWSAL